MKKHLPWLLPILLWLVVVPFTPSIDMAVEHHFFKNGQFSDTPLFNFLYLYGMYPGNIVGAAAAVVFILSYFLPSLRSLRAISLYFPLVLIIGSGLIVNVILKDHWGQPRPRQVVEFGGKQEYRAIWQPNFSPPEPSKAFPCGHCAMGFYFFTLTMAALYYRKPYLFWASLLFTFFFGGLLSLARMSQGAHFFSDVITSALIMWLVSCALFPSRYLNKEFYDYNKPKY